MNQTSQDHDGQQCAALRWLESDIPIEQVPVALLQPGESPRLKSESKAHTVRLLAATVMPPIIVHRSTMGIIDGRARVAAARRRHQDTIAARFFEGSSTEEAFVLGVVANLTTHGRPLSRQDRNADAARILGMYPEWSDRTIAATAGLSHHTVADIRQRSTGQIAQLNSRLGRDGKARPLASNEGRQAAAELIRADQSMSVREVARRAGVSVGTVHDVRARVAQGVDPCVSKTRGPGLNFYIARGQAAMKRLCANPGVRGNDKGKAMLRLLALSLQLANEAHSKSESAPDHCLGTVAEVAAALSDSWRRLAQDLRARAKMRLGATALSERRIRHE